MWKSARWGEIKNNSPRGAIFLLVAFHSVGNKVNDSLFGHFLGSAEADEGYFDFGKDAFDFLIAGLAGLAVVSGVV